MFRFYKVFIDGSISSYIWHSYGKNDTVNAFTERQNVLQTFNKCDVFFTFEEAKLESLRILNKQLEHLKNEIDKYEKGINYLEKLNDGDWKHWESTVFSLNS